VELVVRIVLIRVAVLNTDCAEVSEKWCLLCCSAELSELCKRWISDSTNGAQCL
jgi:hypothetical protein